jgi:hypothetical protein
MDLPYSIPNLPSLMRYPPAYVVPVPASRGYFAITAQPGSGTSNGEIFGLVIVHSGTEYRVYAFEFRTDTNWTSQTPPTYAVHVSYTGSETAEQMAGLIAAAAPWNEFYVQAIVVANLELAVRDDAYQGVAVQQSQHYTIAGGSLLPRPVGYRQGGRDGQLRVPVPAGGPKAVRILLPRGLTSVPPPQ